MKTKNAAESHQTDIPYTFPAGHETTPKEEDGDVGGEGQVDHGPCKLVITTHNFHLATPTQVIVNHILQQAVVQFSATSETVVLLYSSSHFCCALKMVLHTLLFVCITTYYSNHYSTQNCSQWVISF